MKLASSAVAGWAKSVFWRTLLPNLAFVHEDHSVGAALRKAHFVSDQYHRHSVVRHLFKDFDDFVDELRI
jgi:hypothetical protein